MRPASSPIVLDGAMGTTLQRLGLPRGTASNLWNLDRPQAVAAVHRAFVDAGAQQVVANTFLCLPGMARWQEELLAGLRLARTTERFVWLGLGPLQGHAQAVQATLEAPADGVLLETFTDAASGLQAAAEVRKVWSGPLVLSVVPDAAGNLRGMGADALLRASLELGLTAIGVNCVSPETARLALDRLAGPLPLWARPSDPTAAGLCSLADRVDWIGGCCGTPPELLAALAAYVGGPRSTT